jgi:hypothetical protein
MFFGSSGFGMGCQRRREMQPFSSGLMRPLGRQERTEALAVRPHDAGLKLGAAIQVM